MIIAVKTREFEHDSDYDWDEYFPSDKTLSAEAAKLHRALEGVYVDGRFFALWRQPTGVGLTLGVSVSTNRLDAPGRPIRTIAFLRATDADEAVMLAKFFEECLCKSDAETLSKADSSFAKAVESLYQTKKPDSFIAYAQGLPPLKETGDSLEGHWAIPRGNETMRLEIAGALPSLLRENASFLLALTDREPETVLSSLGETLGKTKTIRILSSKTTNPVELETGGLKKKLVGRVGVIAGLCILAAVFIYAGSVVQRGGEGSSGPDSPAGPEVVLPGSSEHPEVDGVVGGVGQEIMPPAPRPVEADAFHPLDSNDSMGDETALPTSDFIDSNPSPEAPVETPQAEGSDSILTSETEDVPASPAEVLPPATKDSMGTDARTESERSE